MEVPDRLAQRLDGEPRSGVALDGDDLVVFTRDRTFIYREEGLLSDAAVEVYGNDIERLSVSQGRRKTTFHLEYIDDTRQFAVANDYAEAVLEGLFGGVLASAGVLADGEKIHGVYLFSDLTVVVADSQFVKHIGGSVWDSDAETYPFESVTGLDFEEGNVATQVVLWVEGRAERIKAPSDEAPLLERTLTRALCEFHGVDSLERLNEVLGSETDGPAAHSSIALEEDISPLIESGEPAEDAETDTVGAVTDDDWLQGDTDDPRTGDASGTAGGDAVERGRRAGDRSPATAGNEDTGAAGRDSTAADIEALERRLQELTRAVDRQNELLERQTQRLAELAERIDSE